MDDGKITLRSYRLAFELERRLHRIDRFRIPVPYGIPLVGMAYAMALAVLLIILSGTPVIGAMIGLLPWPLRLIVLPGLGTRALCHRRPDGRPAHEAIAAYLAFALRAKHLVGLERSPSPDPQLGVFAVAGDERSTMYARGVIAGPATVLLRQPARVATRGRTVGLTQLDERPLTQAQTVRLAPGMRLEVACGRR
jgi:hypothetical protein